MQKQNHKEVKKPSTSPLPFIKKLKKNQLQVILVIAAFLLKQKESKVCTRKSCPKPTCVCMGSCLSSLQHTWVGFGQLCKHMQISNEQIH